MSTDLIVTICGSTRFRAEITEANRWLTLAGLIVLAPGVFGHDGDELNDVQKEELDALHLRKIDLAHQVYVVNPGNYVGDSTRAEIEYARKAGKPVSFLVDGPVDASDLSCSGLTWVDPDVRTFHGRPVNGYAEEMARRTEDHVFGCESPSHIPA